MIDAIATIASVPAIIALVNLAKKIGLPDRLALVLAVVLGVALNLAVWAWGGAPWFDAAATGLVLGLAAAGLYDLAPGKPATVPIEQRVDGLPTRFLRDRDTPPPF